MPHSAARAARLVNAASSNRWRRAPSSANSMMTKNALSTMIPTVTSTTTQGLPIMRPPSYRSLRWWKEPPSVQRARVHVCQAPRLSPRDSGQGVLHRSNLVLFLAAGCDPTYHQSADLADRQWE